jgi:hypothetical protein
MYHLDNNDLIGHALTIIIIIIIIIIIGMYHLGAGIATSYGLGDLGFGVRVPVGSRIFSSPDRPDRL